MKNTTHDTDFSRGNPTGKNHGGDEYPQATFELFINLLC